MSSPRDKYNNATQHWPECTCGLTFRNPWKLIGHLLEVYPPSAFQPADGGRHADATRLRVKLNTASAGAWEVVSWAGDQHNELRVAASIAYRVKSGDLKLYETILRRDIRDTCEVSMYVVDAAMGVLKDYGVIRKSGGRNGVACDDIEEAIGESSSYGQLLHTTLRHVAKMEDEVSALRDALQRLIPPCA